MDRMQAELSAMQALLELMERAKECRRLFEAAGMQLPEPLARFLGEPGPGSKPREPGVLIPPPPAPPAPSAAASDWIWVKSDDASPTAILLGILNASTEAMPRDELFEAVLKVKEGVHQGSLGNIGTRLSADGIIERDDSGWRLVQRDRAPILKDNALWGPQDVFGKQELAAHRRAAIRHLLRLHQGGLQVMQVLEMLGKCPWLHAPLTKEIVQADFEELAKTGDVRHVGHSRKWSLSPER